MNYNYTFFETLSTWKESRELVKYVHANSENFPKHELFGLPNQMRIAASIISSNLSEGLGRFSPKD